MAREIYVKDLGQFMRNQKDKTIRIIMTSIENHIRKNTKEHAEVRNVVLDSLNDLYGIICLAIENHENGVDKNADFR